MRQAGAGDGACRKKCYLFWILLNSDFTSSGFLYCRCTAAIWIEENLIETGKMPKDNLKYYPDTPAAVSDLEIGRIDAVMYDDVSLQDIIRDKPLKTIGSVETQEQEQFGVAIRKEDTALLELMNEGIAELQADPYWEELKEKHNLK